MYISNQTSRQGKGLESYRLRTAAFLYVPNVSDKGSSFCKAFPPLFCESDAAPERNEDSSLSSISSCEAVKDKLDNYYGCRGSLQGPEAYPEAQEKSKPSSSSLSSYRFNDW